ncbi:MAG TPA: GNAT family N-acetyltransferase [Puia sp.]|nr:GNAT family N-acetyltransferase [Puia sp.]
MFIVRTNAENADFVRLVAQLDADLKIRDGEEHGFYAQFNTIHKIKYAVVAYENEIALGCGAFREYSPDTIEIKRMYVCENARQKGIATKVLAELEKWAGELNYSDCILETGKNQPEALGLYKKNRYSIIPNFGQYQNVENSVCFKKKL